MKLRKSFKDLLNSCKLQRRLSNVFLFKDHLHFDLVSRLVYKCTCDRYNSTYYSEMDRHLKVRSGEHIRISPLTFKNTRRRAQSIKGESKATIL